MNNKENVLNNNSNIIKHSFNITPSEAYKDVNKHYKAICFSLVGEGGPSTHENHRETGYIRPLRLIVLQFQTLEKPKEFYSIDVSSFFNKPLKSVILKHSKKIKISKKFGHWIQSYPMGPRDTRFKKEPGQRGLNSINYIVGSDISMHEYVLYIDLEFSSIPLTKSHISYMIAQTLCKTQCTKKSYQASYTANGGVIGAFILKKGVFRNNINPVVSGYYISDYELKQCALANFSKKQSVEITQWVPRFAKSSNEIIGKFNNLLGESSASNELLRSSAPSGSSGQLVSNIQLILNRGTLSNTIRPIYRLVALLTKLS